MSLEHGLAVKKARDQCRNRYGGLSRFIDARSKVANGSAKLRPMPRMLFLFSVAPILAVIAFIALNLCLIVLR